MIKTSMELNGTCLEQEAKMQHSLVLIVQELRRATEINGPFNSAHEGYAVILEEMDELKAEVWKKSSERDIEDMLKEAVQVGAMALRFILDICLKGKL